MITALLSLAVCAAIGYFFCWFLENRYHWIEKDTKVPAAISFSLVGGTLVALFLNQELCVLIPPDSYEEVGRVSLSPVENSIYLAINEKTIFVKTESKWQVKNVQFQFLKKGNLLEARIDNNFFRENVVFLPDGVNLAWVQEMKPIRRNVLKYFIKDSNRNKFFIPPSGVGWGKIEKIETYKFIPG